MRLRFERRSFWGKLGDWCHSFCGSAIGWQNDVENTRIGRICLFLENRFPRLRESSTKDEVNMTTFVSIETHQTTLVHFDFPG